MGRPGTFKVGNKVGVGNAGPAARPRIVTDVIIAKLHEVNKTTGRAEVWKLVDELFEQAYAREVGKGKDKVRILGDLSAKMHIIDRAEGKPIQGHSMDTGGGKVTFVFEPGDEKL